MPAGLPWRVMMTSSLAASRKYFDNSSFTSFRATVFIVFSKFIQPSFCVILADDPQNFYPFFTNIIKNAHIPNAQPILGPQHAAQAFEATFAGSCRLVA